MNDKSAKKKWLNLWPNLKMSQEVVAAKDGDKMYQVKAPSPEHHRSDYCCYPQEYLDDLEGRGQRDPSSYSRAPSASRNGSAGRRPEYAPEDREGYPYLEGDIRQHPTIRGYLPCHPLQGDDRELKDAMLAGSASDAWFPPQPDRHRLSWPQTPQNVRVRIWSPHTSAHFCRFRRTCMDGRTRVTLHHELWVG